MNETGQGTQRATGHRWTSETAKAARAKVRGPLDLERQGTHAEDVLRGYAEIESRLVAAGFPATSPWWQETVTRWYSADRPQLVARVGRRGGKSSSFSRLAVAEALFGHHDVPPGDIGFVAIVSTDRKEAVGRLRTIKAILDALGVGYAPVEGTPNAIEIEGRRGFRVFTASIAGVSGFTSIFVLCDEVSKWLDADTGSNPATEVLRSARPTMSTMPNARIALSSSPMGRFDAHYDAYEQGETDLQITAFAPTWVANPSLTEAATHRLEPDELAWMREYAAIPQAAAESSLLTEALIDQATRRPPLLVDLPPDPRHRYVAAIDPATRGNAWTLVLMTREASGVRQVALARQWRGTPSEPLRPGAVFGEIRELLAPYGVRALVSDTWSQDALTEIAQGAGLTLFTEEPWSPQRKRDAYEALRAALQEGRLELHPDPLLRQDLLGIRKRITRTGVTYELAEVEGRHSDYAPAVAMAAVQALVAAEPDDQPSPNDIAQRMKREFLLQRERERKRESRFGLLPATHRRLAR